jgi:hypothetical protein
MCTSAENQSTHFPPLQQRTVANRSPHRPSGAAIGTGPPHQAAVPPRPYTKQTPTGSLTPIIPRPLDQPSKKKNKRDSRSNTTTERKRLIARGGAVVPRSVAASMRVRKARRTVAAGEAEGKGRREGGDGEGRQMRRQASQVEFTTAPEKEGAGQTKSQSNSLFVLL